MENIEYNLHPNCVKEFEEAEAKAKDEQIARDRKTQWIDCNDRLPKINDAYPVQRRNGSIGVVAFDRGRFGVREHGEFVPEPPWAIIRWLDGRPPAILCKHCKRPI